MTKLLETLVGFFQQEEWDAQLLDNRTVLRMGFSGENGNWSCYAQTREPQQQIVFYSICPLKVSEAKRAAVSELLTRANYGLIVGNFEMDLEDGEVRFKTSLDVEGFEAFSDAGVARLLLRHIVYANVTSMDRYLPALMAVLAGSQDPATAVEAIEDEDEPDLSKS